MVASSFQIFIFGFVRKWCLQNFCSIKIWMMLVMVDRMFLKLRQCQIIWHLLANFQIIILCLIYSMRFVKSVLKHGSWKRQLESVSTNHESLNRTLLFHFKEGYFGNLMLSNIILALLISTSRSVASRCFFWAYLFLKVSEWMM